VNEAERLVSEHQLYREQLHQLLGLVEGSGQQMRDTAALVAEHGGSVDDLRSIISRYGRAGQAMVDAVERTRSKLEAAE